MQKTSIHLLLCVIAIVFIACKKDSQTTTYQGLVLRQADKSPVANALVGLAFSDHNGSVNYSGYTNAKGEYTIQVGETGLQDEYYAVANKKGMVQVRNIWKR